MGGQLEDQDLQRRVRVLNVAPRPDPQVRLQWQGHLLQWPCTYWIRGCHLSTSTSTFRACSFSIHSMYRMRDNLHDLPYVVPRTFPSETFCGLRHFVVLW